MISTESFSREHSVTSMEAGISLVLRAGVLISAGVILLGVVLFALTRSTGYAELRPHDLRDLVAFHPVNGPGYFPTAPRAVLDGILKVKPYAVIELGVLILIATPVLRVALSLTFFARQRDWLYTAITAFVLGVLLASLMTGVG